VVALTSQTLAGQATLDLIWTHLLPGIGHPGAGGATPKALSHLSLPPAAANPHPSALAFRSGVVRGQIPNGTEIHASPSYPTTVAVDLTAGGGGVRIADATAEIWLAIRPGQWTLTPRGPASPIAVAGSAGWDQTGARIEVAFIETPHRLVLTCDAASGTCLAEWVTPPLLARGLRDLGWQAER
jgi:hypothetical protein